MKTKTKMKMKMRTNLQRVLIVSLVAMLPLFISCGDDGDTTPPVINLIEPEDGEVFEIGTHLHIDMEVSDDVMLASYRIEIHSNFDGHEHDDHAHSRAEAGTVDFKLDRKVTITGEKMEDDIHIEDIEIPANATPGTYHLMVYCADTAGNETRVARGIELVHEGEGHEGHEH